MSKSQEKRLAIQDASKSYTYKLLCEIIGICEETELDYSRDRLEDTLEIRDWDINGGFVYDKKYPFTIPELETAIIDLKTYKEKHNDRKNKNS